jgi:catechol 2,3-dioxygenase-like lactoylglutathione lyase family enzyme
MINRLNVASIYVLDKEEALDFYVNKLGLEVGNDVRQGDYRWLTVRVPGNPETEVSLEQPGPPLHDEATAAQLRELRSPPSTSMAPTWACAIHSATPSGSCSRERSPRRQLPDQDYQRPPHGALIAAAALAGEVELGGIGDGHDRHGAGLYGI